MILLREHVRVIDFIPLNGGMVIAFLIIPIVTLLLYYFLRKTDETSLRVPEETGRTQVNDIEIICRNKHSRADRIRWDEIDLIEIRTTDEGPMACDVFFILSHEVLKKGVVIPQVDPEMQTILDRILQFPGFDHNKMIEAMSCNENRWFEVWRKEG